MFNLHGQMYNVRGTVTMVSGDKLASPYLGGYKSLSSAFRKCRNCMAVADNMAVEVKYNVFIKIAYMYMYVMYTVHVWHIQL